MAIKNNIGISNKDRFFFLLGILTAIGSGIAGNILVSSVLDITNNGYKTINTILFISSSIILLLVIIFIYKKLNMLTKTEEKNKK